MINWEKVMKLALCRCCFRKVVVIFVLSAVLVGAIPRADAQDSTTHTDQIIQVEEDAADLGQQSFGLVIFRTIVFLIILIGVIFLFMYFFKHVLYRRKGEGLSIRVVGSTLLGPKKSIYLVEIESRRLVLGVTDASISYLTELEKRSPDDAQLPLDKKVFPSSGGRFRELLDALVKKKGADG